MCGAIGRPGLEPPIRDVIDIIPWAKSIAADASANELTARIAEISAGIPTLDIPDAARTEIEDKLKALKAAVLADPGNGVGTRVPN